ncbi:hypothetical protein CK500_05035 [Halorubrum salipaludis]|uniref:Uncharacterized protein n=1 Tax=Halorubrum salipaludis TaxID=2032630 RepID=A0A2A2FJE9_9EURY|nr:hypothetical protein [Halorubrum salipaludis]PAU84884.1 hypothetical protein CK500_05035 [Halorubrum salipaludis]
MWDRRLSPVKRRDPTVARAQTPIDFAVGAGVFLLTLAFVIAFVPTVFDPFSGAATASPVVSDRVAAGLASDVLATSPTEPGVLSPACTAAFFEGNASLAADAGCPEETEDDAASRFGLDEEVLVVVHSLNESAPIGNASTVAIDTRHASRDVTLSRTTDDPAGLARRDVSVSQRIVSIHGDQYRLTVWVW